MYNSFDHTIRIHRLVRHISNLTKNMDSHIENYSDCLHSKMQELYYLNAILKTLQCYKANQVAGVGSFILSQLTSDLITGELEIDIEVNEVLIGSVNATTVGSNDISVIIDALITNINNTQPNSGVNYRAEREGNRIFIISEEFNESINGHVVDVVINDEDLVGVYEIRNIAYATVQEDCNCLTEKQVKDIWKHLESKYKLCFPERGQLPQEIEDPSVPDIPEDLTCSLLLETSFNRELESGFIHKLESCSNQEEETTSRI